MRNYLSYFGFSADEFADVDRRSYLGPYFGRKLLMGDNLKLDGEQVFPISILIS